MQHAETITNIMFFIFTGTAVLSTIALFTRQSLLVAYILLGALFGPWGLKLVNNSAIIHQVGDIGIIFLLFLIGLHLQPQSLFHTMRKMSTVTAASSLIFFIVGCAITLIFHYTALESLVIGITAMFSSTIIGIKLLPTTTLHHQHTGELAITILLLQDLLAIAVILALKITGTGEYSQHLFSMVVALPALLLIGYFCQRFLLSPMLNRFDKIHEYIFILSIGWCLFMAEVGHAFGISEEIGAFIAGVALASNRISFYIAENLKPLRDFFLVIFFFTIGAGFDFGYLFTVIIPASLLATIILLLKPVTFYRLLTRVGEVKNVSWEIGVRLGQMSEFSLLVIFMALETHLVSPIAASMGEAAIIITFIVSCYWTAMRYPTPLAAVDRLRRD